MEIKELEEKIKYYAENYYQGNSLISDEMFDSLIDTLRKIKPDSPVLTTGWGFEVQGNKVKHKYSHIGSLDKCKCLDDIPDIFKNNNYKVYISPKLDGLSAVAYYENGKLVKGITRGNGIYGKDITNKLIRIIGDKIQDSTFTGAVRGELIISNTNWKLLQNKYNDLISSRNFAAGIINRDEIDDDIQYIDLVVYKVTGYEGDNKQNIDRLKILNWLSHNFKHSIPVYCYTIQSNWEEFSVNLFDTFKENGYQLDGLVLTLEDIHFNNDNGILYTEVAYKFEAPSIETTVVDIEWTLSRTQRYVPVVKIKPVELSGANIERATGNNAKMIKTLGIGPGAEISIQRSGEVIPKIVEEISPIEVNLPSNCPCCNSELQWDGVDLVCKNTQCPNIEMSDLQQWCEIIGETDGLQWTLMKQYLDKFNIHSIKSLYNNKENILTDLNCRQLSLTELKIREFFKKIYVGDVSLYKLLLALNIPRLGDKTCKELSKHPEICKELFQYSLNADPLNEGDYYNRLYNNIFNIMKDATTTSIFNNLNKINNVKYILNSPINRVKIEQASNTEIKYVAITGSLQSMKRKDFEKYIAQFGYELSNTLSKCEYLITNNPNSGSTKNKEAQKYNIPIITENEFLSKLK